VVVSFLILRQLSHYDNPDFSLDSHSFLYNIGVDFHSREVGMFFVKLVVNNQVWGWVCGETAQGRPIFGLSEEKKAFSMVKANHFMDYWEGIGELQIQQVERGN
jgi:hypothetical protein